MARGSTPSEKRPSQNKPIRRADKLVQGARKGRRSDLEELFRRELPPLRRWAFANVPSSIRRAGNTDDFVQMAFLRTLRRLPHLNGANGGTLQPYLRRVLKNLVRDHARAAGRQPAMHALEEWDHHGGTPSPLETLVAVEAYARYRQALRALSPRARTALAARLEQGLDYAAVARRAQCATPAAARTLVGRALARIDALLREDGYDLRHVRPAGRRGQ